MGHEMIFHAWKRFVMLLTLSKGTHWGWMAWRSWHYTWPQTEKREKDQSHQLSGTLKGDAEKNQRQWQDLGSPGRHHLRGSGWQSREQLQFVSHNRSPSLASPFTSIFGWALPKEGAHPAASAGWQPIFFLGCTWFSAPCVSPCAGGWQCWTQPGAEGGSCSTPRASLHPFQPSPLQSQRLLCSALELQSSWGQNLGLVFSFWGSRSLQPSSKRSLNAAYLKAQVGGVFLLHPLHKRMLMLTPLCCLPASFSLFSSLFLPSFPFWEGWIKKHKHFWSSCSKRSRVF